MLGADKITSIEDDSERAIIMKTQYASARDATLEAAEWSFAIKRWIPAIDPDPPLWGASSRFKVPLEILRVLAVEKGASGVLDATFNSVHTIGRRRQTDWVIESGYILTDQSSIMCRGIRRVEDEGIFSALFEQAFAAKLAMNTAFALTESKAKYDAMAVLAAAMLQGAWSRDGLQGSSKRIRNRSLQDVR